VGAHISSSIGVVIFRKKKRARGESGGCAVIFGRIVELLMIKGRQTAIPTRRRGVDITAEKQDLTTRIRGWLKMSKGLSKDVTR